MDKLQLQATVRDMKTTPAYKLRKAGTIPAELYGHNVPNLHLSLSQNEFERVFRKAGESTLITLQTPDDTVHNVLIHDVQKHYLTGQPIHVDFYEVKMTEKLKAEVPLEFIGESKAVKELGGTLVKILDAVEVECLPGDLPHSLTVDIGALATFDDQILVSDIAVAEKVKVVTPGEEVVAKVQPPRDVEAELAKEVGDVKDVEGAAEEKVEGEGEAVAEGAPEEGKDKGSKEKEAKE